MTGGQPLPKLQPCSKSAQRCPTDVCPNVPSSIWENSSDHLRDEVRFLMCFADLDSQRAKPRAQWYLFLENETQWLLGERPLTGERSLSTDTSESPCENWR